MLAVSHAGKMRVVLNLHRGTTIAKILRLSASEHVLGVGDVAMSGLVVAGNDRNRQPSFTSPGARVRQRKILTRYEILALCPATAVFAARSIRCSA